MLPPFAFDPLDPKTRREPYAAYARGRREVPVHRHAGLPLRIFSVFRHADVQAILRDPETWSNAFPQMLAAQGEDPALGPPPPPNMLISDPPQHTRLRSLVGKAFTPRIVQRLEPRMHEVTGELLSRALAAREVDLVQALAYPLPVVMIAEIIGIPPQDRERFKAWSDQLVASLGLVFLAGVDPERVRRQRRLLEEMRGYFVPLAEERKRKPREDLLTGLVEAEHEGSRLSYDEMLGMLVLLLVAGNETTTNLIGNAALELLAHPEAERAARADPGLLPPLVEEVLRFSSPVQFAPRLATRAVELHGVALERGDIALCWIGSANRDEQVFERADRFDPARARNPHLAFGFGAHYCLGANLARLEAQVAIGALLARTRGFERTDRDALPLHPSPVFRAVTRLPVRLEPA
jgi:cytochrome P450